MPKKPQNIRYFKTKDGNKGRPTAVFQRPHPTEPTKRLTTSKAFDTEAECKQWLADQTVKYAKNPDAPADRAKTTFAQLVVKWRKVRFAALAPSSRERYEQVLTNHLLPRLAPRRSSSSTGWRSANTWLTYRAVSSTHPPPCSRFRRH